MDITPKLCQLHKHCYKSAFYDRKIHVIYWGIQEWGRVLLETLLLSKHYLQISMLDKLSALKSSLAWKLACHLRTSQSVLWIRHCGTRNAKTPIEVRLIGQGVPNAFVDYIMYKDIFVVCLLQHNLWPGLIWVRSA